MKTLKANRIEKEILSNKEMNRVRGGEGTNYCGCACAYADNNGSSIEANGMANSLQGVNSPDKDSWKTIVITTLTERNPDEG